MGIFFRGSKERPRPEERPQGASRRPQGRRPTGFTLVELLVCLAIMTLLLALVPMLLNGGRSAMHLRNAAHDLAAALRETRSAAILRGDVAFFSIDVAHGDYRAGSGTVRRLPGDIAVALITTEQDRRDPSHGSIRFFADGSSTGGGLRLTRGGSAMTLRVDWLTGRVSTE
jgi:general secretion pathway protein H